ncbi:MAG TPA: transaldolase [Microbacteriaceae bacterium]|nr:transaldolase [Microbacteriaceae bacterium]
MTSNTQALSDLGVSIWLDDLSRERIVSGGLQRLVETRNVVGVTTNPTIFAGALAKGDAYAEQVAALAAEGVDVDEAVFRITTDDVRAGCDVLRPVWEATGGQDGRVSIEVSPGLAFDTAGTIAEAKRLWATVDRPNAMIKIPATLEGLPAIEEATASGISVNVTLIFSLERYRAVAAAYLAGLERAQAAGIDLSTIRSVASFFVSRVDTEVDQRLARVGGSTGTRLKSRAGVANARLAYQAFQQIFRSERARTLLAAGAHVQRPLWASTGVKDPSLPDTLYVTQLAVADTVNTMPEKTLEATFDHAVLEGDAVTGSYADAQAVIDALAAVGIQIDEVTALLEREGVEKFIASWTELLDTVGAALAAAGPSGLAR